MVFVFFLAFLRLVVDSISDYFLSIFTLLKVGDSESTVVDTLALCTQVHVDGWCCQRLQIARKKLGEYLEQLFRGGQDCKKDL